MGSIIQSNLYRAILTNSDFDRLSSFISQELGIKMPEVKKIMLQSRLQRRLVALNMHTFKEYLDYVFSKEGMNEELIQMIDLVTTNKTDFFRESNHFEFLTEHVLPVLREKNTNNKIFKCWSAGCSTGEEAYSLAICLEEFSLNNEPFDYRIVGTDLSTHVLYAAANGIYSMERIANIPLTFKKKYFLRSKDNVKQTVRVIPELRDKVTFGRLNFMDTNYGIHEMFDVIFFRNVMIYFDTSTQEKVLNKLCTRLKPGGFLFLGHSESIANLKVPLKQIKPTIYIKTDTEVDTKENMLSFSTLSNRTRVMDLNSDLS
jgi:chemotaxis protein methyltransferase CheR